MIKWDNISNIDTKTNEGKLLLMTLAILTSIDEGDIKSGKWGSKTHPDNALKQIAELTNKVFFEKEWKEWKKSTDRNNKINSILNIKGTEEITPWEWEDCNQY